MPDAMRPYSIAVAAYGVSLVDQFRRAASYVDRILRGTNPSELPVQARLDTIPS